MSSSDRPNFLILMSDQHNPHVLGCYGDEVVRTPNSDALAESGVLFEHAYCQSPLCVPSRMSFMTARQPSDIEVWTNRCILPSDVSTFAHALGAAGYETALIGRMHFVGPDQWHGFEKRLVGSLTAVHPGGRGPGLTPDLLRATGQSRPAVTTAGPGRTAYQVYDEVVAKTTADYLREKAKGGDRPFCIVAGFVLPHCPFICPKEDWRYYYDRVALPAMPEGYFENLHPAVGLWRRNRGIEDLTDEEIRRARAGYYGIVTHFDRQVGVVVDTLKTTGLDENTVVIYTSDHGETAGEHGMWWKSNFYEGSVSVPLIVSCPERFEGGPRVREIVSLVDIGPTLLDLAGGDPMPAATGTSLLPLLNREKVDWAEEAFSEHPSSNGVPPTRMIRSGRWKLVHYEGYRPQLFDLESDPQEFDDLGEDPAYASVRDALHRRLLSDWSADEMEKVLATRRQHHPLLREWYRRVNPPDREQWTAPEDANLFPDERFCRWRFLKEGTVKKVRYEEMLPHELEEAIEAFPVAYVPVGSLEWHGRHLPLGNDTIKAHAILVRTARKYGGVVVPGTYWGHMAHWKPGCHPGLSAELVDRLYTEIFEGLVTVGFKVVIGVTGHDVKEQVASLQKAVEAISAEGKAKGFAMMEGSLNEDDPEVGMDHAAKWETSYLMVLRPDLVDLERIRDEDLESESGRKAAGIGGLDPRVYASEEVGERAIESMVDEIGRKAQELLASLKG